MKRKHHALLYGFLSVSLFFCAIWAVGQASSANRLEALMEQGFEQRLSEAEEYLQSIPIKLDKALVSGDSTQRGELILEVSRNADSVVGAIGMLPLSHIALSDTMKFCNQLSEWSFDLALRLMGGGELSDDEYQTLTQLRSDCALLLGQIATARMEMAASDLVFLSEGGAFMSDAQPQSRPLEQVADPERGMNYPSMIYDGAFSDARHYGAPKALGEGTVTAEEAIEIAREYVGESRVQSASRASDTQGVLSSYGVILTLTDGTVLSMEITKQGGNVLWMMPEHASFESSLTIEECENLALAFLRERGYEAMEANHYQLYNGLAVINFVPVEQGVILYPDLIKLQIRMDTGEVVGVEANNYLMNHAPRADLTPKLSQSEALKGVSSRLTVTHARLCVIPYMGGERLCYEFAGEYEDGEYLVYIDANTGEEAEILKLIQTESALMAA